MATDLEIARAASLQPIGEVAARLGIPDDALASLRPAHRQARLRPSSTASRDRPDGKLILVTAINPTPAGEGKTTTTVGLGDGLNRIGKQGRRSACASRRSGPASA